MLVHMFLHLTCSQVGRAVLLRQSPAGVIYLAIMCWENELQGAYLKEIQIDFCK